MTISRLELQGQVTRAQDFTNIKQNEDNKGMINQANFQSQFDRTVETRVRQVRRQDEVEKHEKKYDAKEKGNGNYAGDGGKRRKKENGENEGKVFLKGQGGFDIKI